MGEILALNEYQKRKNGWLLLRLIKPSEKTRKQLDLDENYRYQLWWNYKTNEFVCDCPGFIFKGKCKHSDYFEKFIEGKTIKKGR